MLLRRIDAHGDNRGILLVRLCPDHQQVEGVIVSGVRLANFLQTVHGRLLRPSEMEYRVRPQSIGEFVNADDYVVAAGEHEAVLVGVRLTLERCRLESVEEDSNITISNDAVERALYCAKVEGSGENLARQGIYDLLRAVERTQTRGWRRAQHNVVCEQPYDGLSIAVRPGCDESLDESSRCLR